MTHKPSDDSEILNQHASERAYIGGLLLAELRKVIPWGHEFDLPDGMKASIVKMNGRINGSVPRRPPIYKNENTNPALAGDEEIIGYKPWQMVFDFKLTNCDQDHIEVTASITGGGGMV